MQYPDQVMPEDLSKKPLVEAAHGVEANLEALRSAAQVLVKRLEPVLSAPVPEKPCGTSHVQTSVPMAATLNGYAEAITAVILLLTDAEKRLGF